MDPKGKMIVLQNNELNAVNSFEFPEKISFVEKIVSTKKNNIHVRLEPFSFSVIRIKLQTKKDSVFISN